MEIETENRKSNFIKERKWLLILGIALLIAAVVITIITITSIRNAQKEQNVRDHLEGAILIDRGDSSDREWTVYSFRNNQMAVEHWRKGTTAPEGDLNNFQAYQVSVDGNVYTVSNSSGWFEFRWSDHGTIMETSYDRMFTYRSGEVDIDYERKNFFCEHDFAIKVIKQATCTSAGEEQHTCKKCGQQEIVYPESKHKYEYHKCTVCGKLEKSGLLANTWKTDITVSVLHSQNCIISTASLWGNTVTASYYMVCSNCHSIDSWIQLSQIDLGYMSTKLHTCDECGKITKVQLKVE